MQITPPDIRTVNVTRYVTPLREGGSLPAITEADDGFMYVLKFKGAGQGTKAVIAELVSGEIARKIGFKIPEIVFANLNEAFGRTEPDEEIQDLLKASAGKNIAMHYLSGAFMFDAVVTKISNTLASEIVWFDSFITNVDRTAKNTNMLHWHNEVWLIDHGASLYFHHNIQNPEMQALQAFPMIKDHVLLKYATELEQANKKFRNLLNNENIKAIVSTIPPEWLTGEGFDNDIEKNKEVYNRFLITRLNASENFVKEAIHAREALI